MAQLKKYIVDVTAALALLLSAGVVSCGQAKSGSSTGAPGTDDGVSATGDDGTGASSGSPSSTSPGSSGSGTSGSSGTGATGSSSGSKSSGASSGTATSSGSAGDAATVDLEAPPAGTGLQIATPDYNASDPNASQLIVQPNQEIFLCYYVTLPNNAEVDVGGFQSLMTEGSSHHFIVFQGGSGAFSGPAEPSGTITPCSFGAGTWVYASSTPGEVMSMNMPKNVGLPFAAGTQLILNMHFINTGTTPVYPKVKLNILYAENVEYKAGVMVSFNSGIDVPPATSAGPGTQTVSGTCTAPTGSNFFIMSTHTHKHATATIVDYVHDGVSSPIVYTGATSTYPADQEQGTGTDWEHPGVGQWTGPFLTTAAGDSFKYSCAYVNTGTTAVTVGEYAATNEMCMAIGYYYPAGTATCN
jgi:hypothetical protein